jgi:hypothetical protein
MPVVRRSRVPDEEAAEFSANVLQQIRAEVSISSLEGAGLLGEAEELDEHVIVGSRGVPAVSTAASNPTSPPCRGTETFVQVLCSERSLQ